MVLGPNGSSANVTYLLPYALSLSQNVTAFWTLDQGLPSDWIAFSGSWVSSSTSWAGGSLSSASSGSINIAYYNSSLISSPGSYNLSAYIMINNVGLDSLGGLIIYSRASGGFYAATIGNKNVLEIYRCTSIDPGSCSLVGNSSVSISANTWYFMVFQIILRSGSASLRADLYSPQTGALLGTVSYTDNSPLSVDTVGFIAWSSRGKVTAYFDEAVLSNTDPRFVCAQNLPAGWRMEVWNSTVLVGSSSTGPYSCVQVFNYSTILRQGVVRIYDQANNLRASYPPSGYGFIVGGQIFVITSLTSLSVRILDIVNNDAKQYYGVLSLLSYSPQGFSGVSIGLCNPSTCSSQSISIPPPPSQTSEVILPAGSTSYVSLYLSSYAVGATAMINLYLNYSTASNQGGVVVSLPVVVNLR